MESSFAEKAFGAFRPAHPPPPLNKFLAFDLEFNRNLPKSWGCEKTVEERLAATKPIKITCAGLCGWNGKIWYHKTIAKPPQELDPEACQGLVELLHAKMCKGHTIVSWGGTASDFRVLAAACESEPHSVMTKRVALQAVDIPLVAVSTIGTMMGLNATATAMGLAPKTFGSIDMPRTWKTHPHHVIHQVQADAVATANIYFQMFNAMVAPPRRGQDLRSCGKPRLHYMTVSRKILPWWTDPVRAKGHRFRLPNARECASMSEPTVFRPKPPRDKRSCMAWLQSELEDSTSASLDRGDKPATAIQAASSERGLVSSSAMEDGGIDDTSSGCSKKADSDCTTGEAGKATV